MEDTCTASHSEPKNINNEPNNNAALKVIENCVNQREKRVDLSKKSLQVFPKGFFNLKHVQVSRVSLKYLIHSTYSSYELAWLCEPSMYIYRYSGHFALPQTLSRH